MAESWSIKYRPRSAEELILPDDPSIQKKVDKFFKDGEVAGNILCYGDAGRGKSALTQLLIEAIIKERRDLHVLDRKAEDIDNLQRWLRYLIGNSKQKIVLIEEMDRLSAQAQTLLKDGLMEKYQHSTAFLATTNHIDKIDPALLDRFNTRIDFNLPISEESAYDRLKYILDQESIDFEERTLREYIKSVRHLGLRAMINELETASSSGTLILGSSQTRQAHNCAQTNVAVSLEAEVKRLESKFGRSVLTLAETAKELGISARTLQRYLKGQTFSLHPISDPGHPKFSIRSLAEYLTS